MVTLTQRLGKEKPLYVCVHKLVALAFLEAPPTPYGKGKGCTSIEHIDKDLSNCHVSNLRWVTNRGATCNEKRLKQRQIILEIPMADRLTLRGVKTIEGQVEPTNTADREVSLRRPITGKDQFLLKRWYKDNENNKKYIDATVLTVTYGGGNLSLAVEASPDTRLDVRWNGSGTFTFPSYSQVRNVAVFSADLSTLYGYWKLNKIPFGAAFTAVNGGIPAETGAVATVNNVTGTSSQADATYTAIATTAGNGSGATLDFTVVSGAVSSVSVNAGGTGYPVGETLTVTGHGFTVDVATIS